MSLVQVKILGAVQLPFIDQGAVILKEVNGERFFPIMISLEEATSIAFAIKRQTPPRPFTHDFMKNVLKVFDIICDEVVITKLENDTFYAVVRFFHSIHFSKTKEIDARPSDAIALATRYNAPIYVNEYVFKQVEENQEKAKQAMQKQISQKVNGINKALIINDPENIQNLKKELTEAEKNDDKPKAEKIREEIKKLSN